MKPHRHRHIFRYIEALLIVAGIGALTYVGVSKLESALYQAMLERRFEEQVRLAGSSARTEAPTFDREPGSEPRTGRKQGEIVGRLEIPARRIDVIVLEGTEESVLQRAAGRIPGTAVPEEAGGNIGIAAHRDTFFRNLEGIQAGEIITLTTPSGEPRRFRVESTQVVTPRDVHVLDDQNRGLLTLVTCFPFDYVGAAPRRFIVHAAATE